MLKKLIIGSVVVILVVVGLIINYRQQKVSQERIVASQGKEVEIVSFDITVQIIGEVNYPGIYEINSESRVYDLVILAGGFTSKADTSLNLVQKLKDGMIVKVNKLEASSNNFMVSINEANLKELSSLPNVGSSLANEKKNYRKANGPFTKIND